MIPGRHHFKSWQKLSRLLKLRLHKDLSLTPVRLLFPLRMILVPVWDGGRGVCRLNPIFCTAHADRVA